MKIDLTKESEIASAMRLTDAMRDYDKYEGIVREANRFEEMKKAAGLTSPMHEEMQRIEEMRKLCGGEPNSMRAAMDMGLASWQGEKSRMEKVQKSISAPLGITGMGLENMARIESRPDYLYPTSNVPVDIPILQPVRDPLHKIDKVFKKSESNQAEIAGHLKELVTQAKETSGQNSEMIALSKKNLIIATVGVAIAVIFGIIGFFVGQNSSVPSVPAPVPVVKTTPAPSIHPVSGGHQRVSP